MSRCFKYAVGLWVLLICSAANGQGLSKKVLFLGNSYTGVNDLPNMLSDAAKSTGDTLLFDSNIPGGYTFKRHAGDVNSLSKIIQGGWDYVVLQEQSRYPSFPISQVKASVFPYARFLDSLIQAKNPCAETVFYMTWGRKNGDAGNCASWPPVCTYAGMDSLLNLRYNMMADDNNSILSPVGAVWKYIRQNHPLIELYQSDDSHPSVAGTYAAVCVFYTVLFRKDPTTISFNPALSSTDALRIRNATKSMVYDSLLKWHVSVFDPFAIFSYTISRGNQVVFSNKSLNAQHFSWDFGDGTSDTGRNPEHTFMKSGSYKVQLLAGRCGLTDTTFQTINITMPVAVNTMGQANDLRISPNPVYDVLNFHQHYTKPTAYKIINLTGQTMHSGILPPAIRQIDVSRLPAGVYMMQLLDDRHPIALQKFMKQTQ